MKKTILTAMLFFACLVIGIQSATAQYVNSDDATTLLMDEMEATVDNIIYAEQQEKHVQYPYLKNKVELYNYVYELIKGGQTVEDAIEQGAMNLSTSNTSTGVWNQSAPAKQSSSLTPLHQEMVDLLTQ